VINKALIKFNAAGSPSEFVLFQRLSDNSGVCEYVSVFSGHLFYPFVTKMG